MAAQLYDFLIESELQEYYTHLTSQLNIRDVSQMKQMTDDDLVEIGMTKPEIRRLRKFLKKQSQPGTFNKLRKMLTKGPEELKSSSASEAGGISSSYQTSAAVPHVISRDAISINSELGEGEFGTVHYGVWKTEDGAKMQVAVKTIKTSFVIENSVKLSRRILENPLFDHSNIVKMYGTVLAESTLMVVTELSPMKSLVDCLRDPAIKTSFPPALLCDFAVQIADGMNYLEKKNFVHRDLDGRNVLVFSKDLVKICDHGLTKALEIGLDYYKMNVNMSLKLPIAWCAPESITSGVFTFASDVWSFGVTLWEMFSYGFQPWAGFNGSQIAAAVGEGEGQRLDQPERCPKNFYELMLLCWKHRPDERPSFSEIFERTQQLRATRIIVCKESQITMRSDCLPYCVGEIITLLDKCPISVPTVGYWKGVNERSNKVGFFNPADTLPFVESTVSGINRKVKVNRKESDRKSLKPGGGLRLSAAMISGPQNDLRHMGHVGYDGVVFGDISIIQENSENLPIKTNISQKTGDEVAVTSCSLLSLPINVPSDTISKCCSNSSLISDVTSVVTSIVSSDTLTDVSSMHDEDLDSLPRSRSEEIVRQNILNEDLEDFKIPDISSSFDLGPSLIDEVMKAFGGNSKEEIGDTVADRRKRGGEEGKEEEESRVGPVMRLVPREDNDTVAVSSSSDSLSDYNNSALRTKDSDRQKVMDTGGGRIGVGGGRIGVGAGGIGGVGGGGGITNGTNCNTEKLRMNGRDEVHSSKTSSSSVDEADFSKSGLLNAQTKILERPPKVLRAAAAARDEKRSTHVDGGLETSLSLSASSTLAETRSANRNGMLSRIGSALTKRNGTRECQRILQRSLDLHSSPAPSTSSSSSEFIPGGSRKLSTTSSSSLPGRGAAVTSRPGSFVVTTDEEEADANPTRRLKAANSFNRTKEKIKSVMRSKSSAKGASNRRQHQQPANLNVNAMFFDRLREQEQEMEREELEEKAENAIDRTTKELLLNGHRRNDQTTESSPAASTVDVAAATVVTSPPNQQGIISVSPSFSSVSSSTNRCPSIASHDSVESSSFGNQSYDSICTDDDNSRQPPLLPAASSRASSLPSWHPTSSSFSSFQQGNGRLSSEFIKNSLSPESNNETKMTYETKLSSSSSDREIEIKRNGSDSDTHNSLSFLPKVFNVERSNQNDEEINQRNKLVSSIGGGDHLEDSTYASTATDRQVTSAVQLVKLQPHVKVDVNEPDLCKRARDDCEWNVDTTFEYLTSSSCDASGRESPELVHV